MGKELLLKAVGCKTNPLNKVVINLQVGFIAFDSKTFFFPLLTFHLNDGYGIPKCERCFKSFRF